LNKYGNTNATPADDSRNDAIRKLVLNPQLVQMMLPQGWLNGRYEEKTLKYYRVELKDGQETFNQKFIG
jgi:hypothetical protein